MWLWEGTPRNRAFLTIFIFSAFCIWVFFGLTLNIASSQIRHASNKKTSIVVETNISNPITNSIGHHHELNFTTIWPKLYITQANPKQEMTSSRKFPSTTHSILRSENGLSTVKQPLHYITVDFKGRIGNLLFEYASMYGMSKANNLIPVVPDPFLLINAFRISAKKVSREDLFHFEKKYMELKGCVFENESMELGDNQNVKLFGYFQSWKYFQDWEADIRKEFTFLDSIRSTGEKLFRKLIFQNRVELREATYVGVHVRRGDMAKSRQMLDYGYVSADIEYIDVAMDYFRNKYKNVLFLVGSDDIKWCEENILHEGTILIPGRTPPLTVMNTLTQCNHTIMTVGSFGWWIAWLTGGETTYFKGYPRRHSNLYSLFKSEDYRLPNWIPL